MKTFKPDVKKITGLLGALLFAASMMIGQLPANAVAQSTETGEVESCQAGCNGNGQRCDTATKCQLGF